MQQRYSGNSGLRASSVSLGTMSWSRETAEQDASELLRTFVDAGGALVATAARDAGGQAEALRGPRQGDGGTRTEVVIATKAGVSPAGGRQRVDASRHAI